ncbi:MAG: Ig-like domain-containing protein [Candidatus Shapirobacteria bacterium]
MRHEKRIPTILGLVLLGATIFLGVKLSGSQVSNRSQASGDCHPVGVQITNLTDTAFTISFTTTGECLMAIKIKDQLLPESSTSRLHYFDVQKLTPNTSYPFVLINENKDYSDPSYQAKTLSSPSGNPPESDLAWGKVLIADNQPATAGIIYLNLPGALPLSSLVIPTGNWNISLSACFNLDKTDRFIPPLDVEEEIVFVSPDLSTTQVFNNTSKNNPAPDIYVGKNILTASSVSQPQIPLITSFTPPSLPFQFDIYNPKDSETVSSAKPQFFGVGPAGSTIEIKVESPITQTGEISTQSDGSWNWSPPQDLSPGEHTITVTTKHPQTGVLETISRRFTVLAQDNSLAFSSSPSATLITPTKPVSFVSPTRQPTPLPTVKAIPTIRTYKPSTSSGSPVSGIVYPTLIPIGLAFLSLAFSAYFVHNKSTKK